MKEDQEQKRVVAIVPAAGLGKRFGKDTNKPFQSLGGKPLIIWSLETLESVHEIEEIIPVLKVEDMEYGQKIFKKYNISKIRRIAPGGKERQDSVYNGLRLIKNTDCLVLIHDGVRPFIEKELIEKAIQKLLTPSVSTFPHSGGFTEAKATGVEGGIDGVVLGVPVKDTIKEAEGGIIKKTLKRGSLWAIQTPQIFPYDKMIHAYEKAMKEGFYSTDEAALIEKYGGKIMIVIGSYKNIKITTPEDMQIAEIFHLKERR
jgi:2-C-methyl-D-erythritol 4-phosphate cytidylyltransferase